MMDHHGGGTSIQTREWASYESIDEANEQLSKDRVQFSFEGAPRGVMRSPGTSVV